MSNRMFWTAAIVVMIIIATIALVVGPTARQVDLPEAQPSPTPMQADPEPPPGDNLIPPDRIEAAAAGAYRGDPMLGIIPIGFVFTQCQGNGCSEDWDDYLSATLQRYIEGYVWWEEFVEGYYGVDLVDFVFDVAVGETSYEPITMSWEDQCLWIDEAMVNLGVDSALSCFNKVRSYNERLKARYGTTVAFTHFIVDAENDDDGRFAVDSQGLFRFGYTYIFGPYSTGTSRMGSWGHTRVNQVVAHEIGHFFGAFDQYDPSECARERGYLTSVSHPIWNGATLNLDGSVNPGCRLPAPEPGVMAMTPGFFALRQVSSSTLCQVGLCDWARVDDTGNPVKGADKFPDVLGLPLSRINSDLGTSISGEVHIYPLPTDDGIDPVDNQILKVSLTKRMQVDGEEKEVDQGSVKLTYLDESHRHASFTVSGLNPQIKGLKLCVEFAAGPPVCKILRPHTLHLPLIQKQ